MSPRCTMGAWLAIAALASGCGSDRVNGPGGPPPPPPPPPAGGYRIQVGPPGITLVYPGETARLTAAAFDAEGRPVLGVQFTWSSDDTSRVTVDAGGVVTAKREGNVRISASAEEGSGSTQVGVGYGAARTRCIGCHGQLAGHHAAYFAGATCPACHLGAFLRPGSESEGHYVPEAGHAVPARSFDLIGAHRGLPCTVCHNPTTGTPLFSPKDQNDCLTCHQANYTARHTGSGYPTTCLTCHNPDSFKGARFDHSPGMARFPLVGAHVSLACDKCHDPATGRPRTVPASPDDCVACHQANYTARHTGSGYPTTCLGCHTTTAFRGAVFNHTTASGGFTLVGAHTTKSCTVCHNSTTGVPLFNPKDQNDCLTCHQANYTARHAGSGYPTTCLTCHTTTAFAGATFNHDAQFFPINSKTHRGKWATCSQCHAVPSDYSQIYCFSCHEHAQPDMDEKHKERTGYAYNSRTCLTCHPAP